MPFKPSLVALAVDPTSAPYLGYPLTEIVLEQENGEGAALPHLPTPDARDKITEAVTGSDVRVNRRKLTDLEMDIDYISDSKKAEIERLYHDARSVYLSPNFGPETLVSCPLQRSARDFFGKKTMVGDHNQIGYAWDETDKIFRSWAVDDPKLLFRGAWSRYLRTDYGQTNRIDYPHPNSTSTGWTISVGAGTISYSEDVQTPVLDQRSVTNGKGVAIVEAPSQASDMQIRHSTDTGLSTTAPIMGSICIAHYGEIDIVLETSAGAVLEGGTFVGDGTFQLHKFAADNTTSANQARFRIVFKDSSARDQLAIIGPCHIASESGAILAPRTCDWTPGTIDTGEVTSTDSIDFVMPEVSISFFFQWNSSYYLGFMQIGGTASLYIAQTSNDKFYVSQDTVISQFTNLATEFPLVKDGDWAHCVVAGGDDGLCLYINGVAHSLNGTFDYTPAVRGPELLIGRAGSYGLQSSGMSHFRIDHRQWSQPEIQDHYDTYFASQGRGNIEPTFGKEMIIDEMEWELRPGDDNKQWLGRIVLRELGVEEHYAPMQRQEDM